MQIGRLPTFLIIGSQKSGTSWLHNALAQHPEVVVSTPKELQFFNNLGRYSRGLDWYAEHFHPSDKTRAIGESTPSFNTVDMLEDRPDERRDMVPQRIHDAIPDARLILILRDPVERAVSAYYHFLRKGVWPNWPSLSEVGDKRAIVTEGFYDVHLARWFEVFDREQFRIFIYEDVFRDDASRTSMVRDAFEHIGVDASFEASLTGRAINRRMSHFNLRTNQLPRVPRGLIRRGVPRRAQDRFDWGIGVSEAERAELRTVFEPHVEQLSVMMGRDFPWLADAENDVETGR